MKLSKIETKDHQIIDGLIKQKGPLTLVEKEFILDKFLPHSIDNSTKSGAFFTPQSIAQELSVTCDCDGDTVLDLAAGIGSLSYGLVSCGRRPKRLLCVEMNPEFVEIGKKIVPDAEWVQGDIFQEKTFARLRNTKFNWVVSNPPYGQQLKDRDWLYYNGASELMAVEVALRLANDGIFIIPQSSVPWRDSGVAFHQERNDIGGSLKKFMDVNADVQFLSTSIDMSVFGKDWKGGLSKVEMVHITGKIAV